MRSDSIEHMSLISSNSKSKDSLGWRSQLIDQINQNPLIVTSISLDRINPLLQKPKAIMIGIGLCRKTKLSQALPADVLALALSALSLEKHLNIDKTLFLIADTHAIVSGNDKNETMAYANKVIVELKKISNAIGLKNPTILECSKIAEEGRYKEIFHQVKHHCDENENPYVIQQLSDVAYCQKGFGPIIKLGWTIGRTNDEHYRDEVAFDTRYLQIFNHNIGFVYTKSGRSLNSQYPKASPYITTKPEVRLLLDPNDISKLANAKDSEAKRGLINFYKLITKEYSKHIYPLRGDFNQRLFLMLNDLLARGGDK